MNVYTLRLVGNVHKVFNLILFKNGISIKEFSIHSRAFRRQLSHIISSKNIFSLPKNKRYEFYRYDSTFSRPVSRPSARDLNDLETQANDYPDDLNAQYRFLSSVVSVDPQYVVRRVESMKYATDDRILKIYSEASKTSTASTFTSQPDKVISQTRSVLGRLVYGCFMLLVTWIALGYITTGRIPWLETYQIQSQFIKTRFNDVKGNHECKQELLEIVDFLKNPSKYKSLGCRISNGVLLVGPPGTGKTLLARAVAGEAKVPFFYATGSEFDELYVGVGAARVRRLFEKARMCAPSIIFIDELDAIGSKRVDNPSAPYARQSINQLLTEMDGFKESNVILIGATNDPNVLDPALIRAGRFDLRIDIPLPPYQDRVEILNYYLDKIVCDKSIDVKKIASLTPGASGADLSNLVNQAAVYAARTNAKRVTNVHLDWARDKIALGRASVSFILTDDEKKRTALHEAGHALVAHFTPGSRKLYKASIIPRGPSLGVTHFIPEKDEVSLSYQQLLAMIDVNMGGRAAEELSYGKDHITTGCASDLQNATLIAKKLVTMFGYSSSFGLSNLNVIQSTQVSPDLDMIVHNEVKKILEESYKRAIDLLKRYSQKHQNLAEALVSFETLDENQVVEILSS